MFGAFLASTLLGMLCAQMAFQGSGNGLAYIGMMLFGIIALVLAIVGFMFLTGS